MRENAMVTTMFDGNQTSDMSYYYTRGDNGKVLYCSALSPAEAACKFILATNNIDRIVIIGLETVIQPGDESDPMILRDGRSLFTRDPKELSPYNLLRYRLAGYAGETPPDCSDSCTVLSDEGQARIAAFLSSFFGSHAPEASSRPDLYFHLLAQNSGLQESLYDELRTLADGSDYELYKAWAFCYLYRMLKDSYKLEPLEVNAGVTVQLVPLKEYESMLLPEHVMTTLEGNDVPGADILLCIQNTESARVLDICNLIDMTRVLPDNELKISKTFAVTGRANVPANEISDLTSLQSISELLSGTEAFLKYGKTNIIVDYWKKSGLSNSRIERIIYALRNIDNGISLCDISDIERGIRSLRELIMSGESLNGDTPVELAFNILLEGIRRDYGNLLKTDQIEFIDLVRWAYRKEFWQQTLTLIESRAPRDFVNKGFYFYCDSESDKEEIIKIFGQLYYDLKSYEKYKMDDLSHYYVKFYNRGKASHQKHGKEYMQNYAHIRVEEIDSRDDKDIRACTACPDRTALENLLFAYYYVGDTRNSTNHAEDTFNGFSEIMADSDSSERMDTIRQCVDYFLHCYDKVSALTEGKPANVIRITNDEITKCADEIRNLNRKKNK